MAHVEQQYLSLLRQLLEHGVERGDRTGIGTKSIFGNQMVFDLSKGQFPLITTKKVNVHGLMAELDWFLSGSDNINDLIARSCNIWNPWMKPIKDVGDDINFMYRPIVAVDAVERAAIHQIPNIPGVDNPIHMSDEAMLELHRSYVDKASSIEAPDWVHGLWLDLLDKNFVYYCPHLFSEAAHLNDGRVRGMCDAWFDFETFAKDIVNLTNYSFVNDRFKNSEDGFNINHPYRLTGMYYNSSIVGPNTADFLCVNEINTYVDQEQLGIFKISFKPNTYGDVTPMYTLIDDDELHRRIHSSLDIDNIEIVSVKDMKARLR
jgi:hypothetical protein